MKLYKIRNVIIVMGIFGLLAGSLYVNSLPSGNNVSNNPIGQTSNNLSQALLSTAESYSAPTVQQAPTPAASNDSSSTSSPSTPGASVPDSSSPAQPSSVTPPAGGEDILTQVQNSVHNKVFPKTEGLSCEVCHKMINDSYPLHNKSWESCGSCHVNSSRNPIIGHEVQNPQFQMIQGVAIGDLLPMPSYKYKYMKDTFSCTDCHLTNASKHDFLVPGVTIQHDSDGIRRIGSEINYQEFKTIFNQDKCALCHPSSADMVDRVKKEQETITQKLTKLKPVYEEWSAKIASMNPEDPKAIAFKNGATYYTFVETDGSKGVHNFLYTLALLERAESYWSTLDQ